MLNSTNNNNSNTKSQNNINTNNNNNYESNNSILSIVKSPQKNISNYKPTITIEELHNKYMKGYKTEECNTVIKKLECAKDRDCFYYHKLEEKRRSPYDLSGNLIYSQLQCQDKCGKPNCKFAHNDVEIMYHPAIYKTRLCNDFGGSKTCKKGRWCAFAHGDDDLRTGINDRYIKTPTKKSSPSILLPNNNSILSMANATNASTSITSPQLALVNISNTIGSLFDSNTNWLQQVDNGSYLSHLQLSSPKSSSSSGSNGGNYGAFGMATNYSLMVGGINSFKYYPEYYEISKLNTYNLGKSIRFGVLRVDKNNPLDAYLDTSNIPQDLHSSINIDSALNSSISITINGLFHRNRAFDGDFVAVDISPESMLDEFNNREYLVNLDKEIEQVLKVNINSNRNNYESTNNNYIIQPISAISPIPSPTYNSTVIQQDSKSTIEGRVVSILNSNHKQVYSCFYQKQRGDYIYFSTYDKKMIGILVKNQNKKIDIPQDLSKTFFEITIQQWPTNSPFPLGEITQYISNDDTYHQTIQLLKAENNIKDSFSDQIRTEVQLLGLKSLNISHAQNRKDLRKLLAFSISEHSNTDVQVLYSCNKSANGNITFYVHVTDVAFYIKAKSSIDLEALSKGFTIGMDKFTSKIFPKELIDILKFGFDKEGCAITISWEFNSNRNIEQTFIFPSIVKASHNLTLKEVSDLLGQTSTPHKDSDLVWSLQTIFSSTQFFYENIPNQDEMNIIHSYGKSNLGQVELPYHILNEQYKMIANYIASNINTPFNPIYKKIRNRLPDHLVHRIKSNIEKYPIFEGLNIDCLTLPELLHISNPVTQKYILSEIEKSGNLLMYTTEKMQQYLQYPFMFEITNPLESYVDLFNQRLILMSLSSNEQTTELNGSIALQEVLPNRFKTQLALVEHLNECHSKKVHIQQKFSNINFMNKLNSKSYETLGLVVSIENSIIGIWVESINKVLFVDLNQISGCKFNWSFTKNSLMVYWNPKYFGIDCTDCNRKSSSPTQDTSPSQLQQISRTSSSLNTGNAFKPTTMYLKVFDQIKIQISSIDDLHSKSPKYFIQFLYGLKDSVPWCFEHLQNRESFLNSKFAFEAYKPLDTDISYANYWNTLIDLNSVHKSLSKSNSIFAYNVAISWSKKKKKYVGSFSIPLDQNTSCVKIARGDFLCLRYTNDSGHTLSLHTLLTKANYDERTGKILLRFSTRSSKLTQKSFSLEIIFRDEFNRNLTEAVHNFVNFDEDLKRVLFDQNQLETNELIIGNPIDINSLALPLSLNSDQIIALTSSIHNPFTIIEGPPGSGKSTLASILCQIAVGDKSNNGLVSKILLCGPTEHSVDASFRNLIQLFPSIKALRLYKSNEIENEDYRIPDDIRNYTLSYMINERRKDIINMPCRDLEGIILNEYKVICCTSQTSMDKRIVDLNITWVVIDNSNQELEPSTICTFTKAKHVVLMVDVVSDIQDVQVFIKKQNLKNLFIQPLTERLKKIESIKLKSTLNIPNIFKSLLDTPMNRSLTSTLKPLLSFFDLTKSEEKLDIKSFDIIEENLNTKYFNELEVSFIIQLIKYLINEKSIDSKSLVVVSPFKSQRWLIERRLSTCNRLDVKVVSHQEAQYTAKEYVIVSLVRSNKVNTLDFANEDQFLRHLLLSTLKGIIFVGNMKSLKSSHIWKQFTQKIENLGATQQLNGVSNLIFTTEEYESFNKLTAFETM